VTHTLIVRGAVAALLLSVCICLPALAETVPRSVNELTALALKQSAELAALEKESVAKQSLAIQAGTLANPTLELQGATGSLTGSPEDRSLLIGVNQELALNDKLSLRREAGQREAEAVQLQRENAVRLLKDDVATAALELSLAGKRHELATELVKLNRELVTVAGERFTAGDIPELDLNLARVELARAESRVLEGERERIPLCIKIASLTGLKEDEIILADKPHVAIPVAPKADLVKLALAARQDLLAVARGRDRAATDTRLAAAEALPNLTAGVFVQWQRGTTELGGLSSISSDTQLGVRLSMPLPVFDRNTAGRAAARARQEAAEARLLALERAITAEVEAATARLSSAQRILALLEQGVIRQLTENLKLTQEAYRLGEVGILSVIEEQKKFFEVSDGYLSALHERHLALSKLETATATNLGGGAQ
jgi:outer membrane protein, heavy metal efflux system